jgi:hypothetical protein
MHHDLVSEFRLRCRPSKVPLSAFIVEDMIEYVQAHATYRFVIFDEEDERPRLLVGIHSLPPSMS